MITPEQLAAVKAGNPAKKKPCKHKAKKTSKTSKVQDTDDKKVHKPKPVRGKTKTGATARIDRELFCEELIKHSMNASAAYKAVSPKCSDKTAGANGHKLLKETETVELLVPRLRKLFIDAGIEAEYVFKRWLEMSTATAADYFTFENGCPRLDMSDMTPAQRANLKKISIKPGKFGTTYSIEVYDAQRAVSEIAKHLGLLIDRLAEEDVDRIGDLLEQGINRIRESGDLDGWKGMVINGVAYHGE